jgi:alanyl aminopeptidase
MRRAWLLLLAACPAPPSAPTGPPSRVVVEAPVPDAAQAAVEHAPAAEPTLRLPREFLPTGYAARLAIDPARSTFDGTITIAGDVAAKTEVVWLHGRHLAIKSAAASRGDPFATPAPIGSALTVTPHGEDLLELRADPPLEPDHWRLQLDYTGELDEINTTGAFKEKVGKTPYVYTQFEALYARRVFPCLDEPDSKVPWQLTLDVPKGDIAVSNTPMVKDTPMGDSHRVEFAPTPPLPSYLVAFGVGPFDIVSAGTTKRGTPVRIITMKDRGAEAAYAAKTTPRLVDLLEDWFSMPYPYPKLDILVVPITVGFGAMENAGLITFTERRVLMEGKPSWERRARYARVAAHELSHQWFGDLVTTAWWDDIWLNEGFANWLENKITAKFEPAWHAEQNELDERLDALRADALTTARRIRQPIETPGDILNVFDGITYDKGASVLDMFESYVGAETFQKGVREYVAARANGNATSADFVAAISKVAGKDLAPAFATFLDQGGAPQLEMTLECGRATHVDVVQQRFVPPGSGAPAPTKPWLVPVCVAYERDGKRAEACGQLDGPGGAIALDTKTCPRWVMPNVNARGYYTTLLAGVQVSALRDEAWPLLTWTERRGVFHDAMQTAETHPTKVPLALALSLVPKLLTGGDRFTIDDAIALPAALDMFVADDQRPKYEAWHRMTFGPGATKLGLVPKDSDDLDAELSRQQLIHAAVWIGREPELVKQAVELGKAWRDAPDAMRPALLQIAADADAELFDRIRAELKAEPKRHQRDIIYTALSQVRDPKRYEAALPVVLDPALDVRESIDVLFEAGREDRPTARAFYVAHEAELDQRLPKDETARGIVAAARLFTSACDLAHRDDIADFVTKTFAARPGGQRVVNNVIEDMDQCIARRNLLDPGIRGWLNGVKIPRPPTKKK